MCISSFLVDGELRTIQLTFELVFILMSKVQILRVCKIRFVAGFASKDIQS